jgi:type VI secretion system protein ImpF
MAELGIQERLQPALLDRLADDEPEKRTEPREQRVMSIAKLRSSILRDLSWLLNTVRLAATEDLSECPFVERSTLNFGVPSFAGDSIDRLGITETEVAIREAILRYEPRLIANSVKVKLVQETLRDDSHNTIALEIDAELWCQPLPLQMFMRTELDLEIGSARVIEQSESDRADRRPRRRR